VGLIKRAREALKGRASKLAWAVLEGAIGAGVGLLLVTLYLAAR
jgi:hypothetical protein